MKKDILLTFWNVIATICYSLNISYINIMNSKFNCSLNAHQ